MAKDVRGGLTVADEGMACPALASLRPDWGIPNPAALVGVRANHRCCHLGADPSCLYLASSLRVLLSSRHQRRDFLTRFSATGWNRVWELHLPAYQGLYRTADPDSGKGAWLEYRAMQLPSTSMNSATQPYSGTSVTG